MSQDLLSALTVAGLSMLPVIELMGAIPVGLAMGLSLWLTFLIALVGSSLPAAVIMPLLKPMMTLLHRTKVFRSLVRFIERKGDQGVRRLLKSKTIYIGLFLVVAIPLPGTGVWSGALFATLLGMRMRHALLVIWAGNLIAGLCVLFFSYSVAALF